MRHPVLFGEYELTIDSKNRLLVPSEIRKAIRPEEFGEAFFLVVGVNGVPWFYPEKYYEQLVTQETQEVTPGEAELDFDQMYFSMASKIEWDGQGRILVPDKILKRTNTGSKVTLIGVKDHLQLWNTADWEVRREELAKRRTEIALKAKQARQNPGA